MLTMTEAATANPSDPEPKPPLIDPVCGSGSPAIATLERLTVRYPRWKRIYGKIEDCRVLSKNAAEPRCLLIVGRSGVGKTSLIQKYLAEHPPRETAMGRVVPVLFAQIPAPATIKAMASHLLEALGDPMPQRGTLDGMTQRSVRLIAACQVELIILDEFQHFIDREKNFKVLQTVSDWLKNLINSTRVPIVLVGMPESVKVLTENDQLARRFMAKERLSPFQWREDGKDEFIRFLEAVSKKLPLAEKPMIYSVDVAQRMFWATEGRTALVMKIVRSATREALVNNWKTITIRELAKAYTEALVGDDDELTNPFLGPIPPIDAYGRPVRLSQDEPKEQTPKKRFKAVGSASKSDFSSMVKGKAA
ncbi:MAG: TniB family NTP-binding protein [Ferrovibrio sp.]